MLVKTWQGIKYRPDFVRDKRFAYAEVQYGELKTLGG
jgi:hypothetical protein